MKKNVISPFIQLLWNIVENPNNHHIITWNHNGTSFCISDPQTFSSQILSKHFKHSNISSFIRQLNMYNFHKNKINTKQLEFYHRFFRKNAKNILIAIKRKPSQSDLIYGQQLFKQFFQGKQNYYTNGLQENCNDILKDEQKAQSTTVEQTNRKFSNNYQDTDKIGNQNIFKNFAPKKIVNIVLVNKYEQLQPSLF